MILSIGLVSSIPAVFAETEIIFEENFDNGLSGWTLSQCTLGIAAHQECNIGTSTTSSAFDTVNNAPSSPNWGYTEIFSDYPPCKYEPIEVKHKKTFTVDEEGDYDLSSQIATTTCTTCKISSQLYIDGTIVFDQTGKTGNNPLPPTTINFHETTISLQPGEHTLEIGMQSDFACSGNFRSSFDDIRIEYEMPTGPFVISDDITGGDCKYIGNWHSASKTCTLTDDLFFDGINGIIIGDDGITLDGNGYKIEGVYPQNFNPGPFQNGVLIDGKTGVTVRNLQVVGFNSGIHLIDSNENMIKENSLTNNGYSIQLDSSHNNEISSNTLVSKNATGINLDRSNGNEIVGNEQSGASYGLVASNSNSGTIKDNTFKSNRNTGLYLIGVSGYLIEGNTFESSRSQGIQIDGGGSHQILGNTINSNGYSGIRLSSSSNTISGNIISSNNDEGILLLSGWNAQSNNNEIMENEISNNGIGISLHGENNSIYNNNFIDNDIQAIVPKASLSSVFNLDAPVGGNYWNNFDTPQEGCYNESPFDQFCDAPYIFSGGQDNLPWTNGEYEIPIPPEPKPIPQPGLIAFDSSRDSNNLPSAREIYVMNADGTNPTRLTFNTAMDVFASWSPDGTKIAFASTRDGNAEIYVMNADGSSQTNISNNPASDVYPSWSPDGTKIVFARIMDTPPVPGGNLEIFVMNADGTGQTRLTSNTVRDINPSWSPDGTKIVFQSDDQIYVMNTDGTGQTKLTSNSTNGQPSWSPDGTKILFGSYRDGNSEFYVMNADGTGQTNISNNPASDAYPSWSPDGTWIVFVSVENNNHEIYIMNVDGTGRTNISNNPAYDTDPVWQPIPTIPIPEIKPEPEPKVIPEPEPEVIPETEEDKKITICHIPPGNHDNPHTISISENAWPAHLKHGDTMGECIVTNETPEHGAKGDIEVSVGNLVSSVAGDFVTISGHDALESEEIFITILSESNQVVLDLNIFSTKDGKFSTIWMIENDLAPGTYTIKASDGEGEGKTTYTIFGENPPPEADVIIPAGTSVPGCEETNECFSPAEISIQVGNTVTWYNDDSAAHTVISGVTTDVNSVGDVFDSGLFFAGDTFSYKFTSSGNVPYFCIVHPWMTGKVIVGDDITPQDNAPTVPTPNVHIPTVTAPTTTPPVTTPPVTTPPVTTPPVTTPPVTTPPVTTPPVIPPPETISQETTLIDTAPTVNTPPVTTPTVTTPPVPTPPATTPTATKSEPIPFTAPHDKKDKNSPQFSHKSIYQDGSII